MEGVDIRTHRKPMFKPCHTTLDQCNETNLMAAGKTGRFSTLIKETTHHDGTPRPTDF
jgi:hypothetical protein